MKRLDPHIHPEYECQREASKRDSPFTSHEALHCRRVRLRKIQFLVSFSDSDMKSHIRAIEM